jgi:hypothetical protein
MYLLIAALVSTSAEAGPLTITNLGCGLRPPPCLKFLDSDAEIMPSDWYRSEYGALDGRLNYFRVEVNQVGDPFRMSFGDYELGERYLSTRESDEHVDVYYVPASLDAWIRITTESREPGGYEVLVTGATYASY